MTHFPARPDAPVACDMSAAADTPEERLAEYVALLVRSGDVVVSLRVRPGVRDAVDDLVRRESACCPFLDLRVESRGERVVVTATAS